MPTKMKRRGSKRVDPELLSLKRQIAGALRKKIADDKITIAALARKIGTGRSALRRVLDESNTSCTLRTMFATATAVGLRLKLEAEPMATEKLMAIAKTMVEAPTDQDGLRLEHEFLDGFYGTTPPADATNSTRQHPSGTDAASAAAGT